MSGYPRAPRRCQSSVPAWLPERSQCGQDCQPLNFRNTAEDNTSNLDVVRLLLVSTVKCQPSMLKQYLSDIFKLSTSS